MDVSAASFQYEAMRYNFIPLDVLRRGTSSSISGFGDVASHADEARRNRVSLTKLALRVVCHMRSVVFFQWIGVPYQNPLRSQCAFYMFQ